MSEVYAKTIVLVNLDDIKLNPKNRNKHTDEQIERLAKIIQKNGLRRPGTISNRTGYLVCGEGRYYAIKKLGLKKMPVMFQDYLDAKTELADAVADNAIDKWATLDESGVMQDVEEFDDFDLDTLGIKGLGEETEVANNAGELSIDQFDNFQHQCPKCGFEWNEDGTT